MPANDTAATMTRTDTTLLGTWIGQTDSAALATGLRAGAVVLITALTAAAAQISIPLPFTPVPFTFQPMVVLLGGAALGARLGMSSQVLYLLIGIAGFPVFAASPVLPQGAARLLGPTAGYLLSYPLAAFLTGWLAERGMDRRYITSVLAMSAGLAVVFAMGVSWLGLVMPIFLSASAAPVSPAAAFGSALRTGLYPFVVPDLVKLCLAAAILPGLWRLTGRAPFGSR